MPTKMVGLCREAVVGGEVDIYIDNDVYVAAAPFHLPNPFEDAVKDEEEGVDDDGEDYVGEGNEEIDEEAAPETNAKEQGVQDDGEDPVEEGRQDDPRFEAYFEEVHNGIEAVEVVDEATIQETDKVQEEPVGEELEDEDEFERQCFDIERPDPAMDTDDEWDAYYQALRATSRKNFSKDKPPYIWVTPKFNSGEEFKDQLLRYVLKTNYDVKLCRWDATKLAAICSHEKCKWKIYCSAHKCTGKWIVQTYVDEHKSNSLQSYEIMRLNFRVLIRIPTQRL